MASYQQNRRGAMAVFATIVLSMLLIFLGFSVDVAQMQRARTELRAATDLATKAACTVLADTGDVAQAIAAGQSVASANLVANQPLTLDASDFVFGNTTRSATGKWVFTADSNPTNALRLTGRRTNSSAGGAVPLFFSGFLGHSFEPTVSATAAFVDVDICLVLDRSSSMKLSTASPEGLMPASDPRECNLPYADSRWVALDNSIGVFMSQLSTSLADERVAVITFASAGPGPCGETNTEVSTDQTLTSDSSLVTAAMTARSTSIWNGMTNIREALQHARTYMAANSRPLAEKMIILLTDGVYTSGDPTSEAQQAYDDHGIIVHTITFGAAAGQPDMQQVALAGHGRHHHAPDEATLDSVFYEIAGSITILTD